MSLKPSRVAPVPELTARVAHAAFPKGNLYLAIRDELGTLFEDDQFSDLFPARGKAAFTPWRLAFITILQFAEGLSDRHKRTCTRKRQMRFVVALIGSMLSPLSWKIPVLTPVSCVSLITSGILWVRLSRYFPSTCRFIASRGAMSR